MISNGPNRNIGDGNTFNSADWITTNETLVNRIDELSLRYDTHINELKNQIHILTELVNQSLQQTGEIKENNLHNTPYVKRMN